MRVEEWLGSENKIGIDIWKKKYQNNNETFDEWLDRVSSGNADVRKLIEEKKFLFGGRTLANRGTSNNASYFNCYSRGYVEDDYADIMNASVDIGLTFKAQGGQGISLSKLRPKGTPIKEEYTSDGIVPFMKIYNEVTAGTSQGGCILETELVLTNQGYKQIKDIQIGDMVYTKTGYQRVNAKWDKGIQETYKVKTSKGYEIVTTKDHKFCVDGFKTTPLSQLSEEDKICLITRTVNKMIIFNPLSYIVAAFMANGYIAENEDSGNISVDKKYPQIAEKIKESIIALGFESRIREEENVYRVIITAPFGRWLKEKGYIKTNCFDIFVPEDITRTEDEICSYLAGALDTDGCLKDSNYFSYSTTNETYAKSISNLMKAVGFFPTIQLEKRQLPKHDLYVIHDSFRKNTINIIPSEKIIIKEAKVTKNSRYSTPYTIENSKIDRKETSHLGKISKNNNIGLCTYLNIQNRPYEAMIFDKIEIIENYGEQQVYDIGLENEHLFHCNGFYVSNSRKGALMLSIDARHKEAETFIQIKSQVGEIEKANLSLEVDDEFMKAVETYYSTGEVIILHEKRNYSGHIVEYDITPIEIFKLLVDNCYDWADPACLFVNRFRNYNLMEFVPEYDIETSNPCGRLACRSKISENR